MNKKRYIISTMALVVTLVLTMLESCRTEICYNHFPVADISLFWEQEWERDYGMKHSANWNKDFYGVEYDALRPVTPEWVSLVRYNKAGEVASEKYLTAEGGQLIINSQDEDSYLLYNSDTEYIIFSDMASLPDARATATSRTRASIAYVMERHPGVRTMNPPDVLYSAYVNLLPYVKVHETKAVPLTLQPLVYTYVIRYEFETGIQHVALSRGAIGGMAESVYLRDGRTSDETAIILYDCEVKDYGCEAKVRSFGTPSFPDIYYGRATSENEDKVYTLNLEVMLKNGKILEYNFDISDQLKNQPRGGVIKVGGIRIEDEQSKPDPVASGFSVDLMGWGSNQDVDLPVSSH